MALQTLSSAPPPAPTFVNGTNPNNSNDNKTGDPHDPTRNSIPFSFLVAFLALFVAFMGIGLFARRILYAIRLRLGLPVPEVRQRSLRPKRTKPVLWDVYPERRGEVGKWNAMEPLSCWLVREEPQPVTPDPPPVEIPRRPHIELLNHGLVGSGRMAIAPLPFPPSPSPSPTPGHRSHTHHTTTDNPIRDFINGARALFTSAPIKSDPEDTGDEKPYSGMRVAVLVAMPSEDRKWREKMVRGRMSTSTAGTSSCSQDEVDLAHLGEVSLGIADMPWNWEEQVLTEEDKR
ncbi:hypothetical protein BDW22DRAFT_1426066 [Trametopsis cervina]|nr:hypothetical protein BDW22DRAFT_1426066 [Trametopsis cervina]